MSFWDKKYATETFGYGLKPNYYFAGKLEEMGNGAILLPGEGEGRNAFHAAQKGWKVMAFDESAVAREKAINYALKHDVKYSYHTSDFTTFTVDEKFDLIAVIFVHFMPEDRKKFHQKMLSFLKNDGRLIMEVFSKNQINRQSGGPKNPEMLYSIEDIVNDFSGMHIEQLEEQDVHLDEGPWHQGDASVLRAEIVKN